MSESSVFIKIWQLSRPTERSFLVISALYGPFSASLVLRVVDLLTFSLGVILLKRWKMSTLTFFICAGASYFYDSATAQLETASVFDVGLVCDKTPD